MSPSKTPPRREDNRCHKLTKVCERVTALSATKMLLFSLSESFKTPLLRWKGVLICPHPPPALARRCPSSVFLSLSLTNSAEGSGGMTALSAFGHVPPLRSWADSVSLSPASDAVSRASVSGRQAEQGECEWACMRVCYTVAQLEREKERERERGSRITRLKARLPAPASYSISKWSMFY